jgi:hypothetical protein
MSEIFGALRALEVDQHDPPEPASLSRGRLLALPVSANDFAALEEFTAPRTPEVDESTQITEMEPAQSQEGEFTVSATDLIALEDRVSRAVEIVKLERESRLAAEERASQAREELSEMERELRAFRSGHDHGRKRVQRMLSMLESL